MLLRGKRVEMLRASLCCVAGVTEVVSCASGICYDLLERLLYVCMYTWS